MNAHLHSLQRIVDRLRLFAHALALVRSLIFQLCDARVLAVFQTFGIYRRESSRLLSCERCDLEVLDARDGDDVVVAGVAGSSRTCVDRHEVKDRACGEQGAFVRLRMGSGGGELDAEGNRVSLCYVCWTLQAQEERAWWKTYRAPMALPSASTVSTGAGVLALGVATLVVFVVLAMLVGETVVKPRDKQFLSILLTLLNGLYPR